MVYNSQHSFVKFKAIGEFKELSLNSMHKKLKNFHKKFNDLKNVTPQTKANKDKKVLENAGDLYNELYYIYKEKYNEEKNSLNRKNKKNFDYTKLRLTNDYQYESENEEEQQTSKKFNKKEPPIKPTKTDVNELNELIVKEETDIDRELFKNYFKFQMPTAMLKTLYNLNDRKKNNLLVNTIKSELSNLKNEIKKMSEDETENEEPHKIVDIVERILDFNRQKQEGKGLKILTPNQMLSRLPVSLAQLKAGNTSEKLKNEIRQMLYSLCRSKKLTKQI